jgi:hypothetical protein
MIIYILVALTILASNLHIHFIFSYSLGANTSNNIVQAFMSDKLNKEQQ